MNHERFSEITNRFSGLRAVVLGDFCLDRYLEIDPLRQETSIETGLPVHNVVRVRAQPGGAGTILNNLSALGIGTILPVGFAGDDGEGFELRRALGQTPGVKLDCFLITRERRTFTYCKPLVIQAGIAPRELNRLDSKNWTPTPPALEAELSSRLLETGREADCVVVLDQVDLANTGVVTATVLQAVARLQRERPDLLILADSRRGLSNYPPLTYKMNAGELQALFGKKTTSGLEGIGEAAVAAARRNGRNVFVTLSEQGIMAGTPQGEWEHLAALPVRGEIDIVGAGDAVSANLASATAAGATLQEALEIANAAASVVVHKLGTTGTASVTEIRSLLFPES